MARQVWSTEGFLVASFLQEGLVRPSRDWVPEVDPLEASRACPSLLGQRPQHAHTRVGLQALREDLEQARMALPGLARRRAKL